MGVTHKEVAVIPLILAHTLALAQPVPTTLAVEHTDTEVEPEDRYPRWQVSVHGGLLQPLFARGFNAAIDVRHHRLVLTYSHGEGLDLTSLAGFSQAELDGGARMRMPSTTGFGVGATLVDELYVLADFKLHDHEVSYRGETENYRTLTVGGEVGYRLFFTRGLFVAPVVRFWPNVWESRGQVQVGGLTHEAMSQGVSGLFANVLIGGSFDVRGRRRTGTATGLRSGR